MNLPYLVFERSPAFPDGLVGSFVCFTFALLIAWVAVLRRRPEAQQPAYARLVVGLVTAPMRIFMIAMVLGVVLGAKPVYEWLNLRELLQQGALITVEGDVTLARAWYEHTSRSSGHWREEIEVGGRKFQYAANDVGTPYPMVGGNGGVLKAGKPVRITLAGDAIYKVETNNACQVYRECSLFGVGSFSWESERK